LVPVIKVRASQREEAFALHKKKEALCLELGNRSSLGYCYWNWGLLAREQRDRKTERQKLATALDIFTELNMPREREAVRAELEKMGDRATQKFATSSKFTAMAFHDKWRRCRNEGRGKSVNPPILFLQVLYGLKNFWSDHCTPTKLHICLQMDSIADGD
jgi:hypothetical protein